MMKRRKFITLLGGGAAAWPLAARAQQPTMPVIGFLSTRSPGESAGLVAAFRDGLRESGFVEGQNLVIAFRWAEGRYEQLRDLAAELVAMHVAVLMAAGGPPSALAAKAATSTIPIVFSAVYDPVQLDLVASLNRPGANITGMSSVASEMVAKSCQLLKEMVPTAAAIACLVNPTNGLVVPAEPFFFSQRDRIVALAARYAVAMIANFREYVVAGGLMSYGASLPDLYRQAGLYVGRVLKGAKPADLPVMQPTKFELIINLKTAKALGLQIPDKLLALADEVIE